MRSLPARGPYRGGFRTRHAVPAGGRATHRRRPRTECAPMCRSWWISPTRRRKAPALARDSMVGIGREFRSETDCAPAESAIGKRRVALGAATSVKRLKLFRSSALNLKLVAGASLRRGQASSQHAEGRTGNIVHPDAMAELDRGGVAAVLAANSDFEIRTGLASAFDCRCEPARPHLRDR